ncbi:MAG: glycoside hydrolase N-terminal domain-containing protein, partial [Spirochaetaceae bacterium]|nr:glycoside hydrolase N-terminal domain-containing protein [Spirochaetaceae bacterium]
MYAGRHFDAERYCQRHLLGPRISPRSYQPAGYLAMELGHGEAAVSGYRRQLDLRTAVATVAYRCAGVRHRREAFVSAADDVVVLRFDSDAPGVGATFALQHPAGESGVTDRRSGAELVMTARAGHGGRHSGVRFAAVVRLIVDGDGDGGPVDTPESLGVRGARSVTVLTAIATDYRLDDPSLPLSGDLVGICRRRLDDAAGRPYAELRARHESDHARLFGRVDFQIAVDADRDRATDARVSAAAAGARDPGLLLLYFHYCRYLFISASRPGTLPANLQGVWNPLLQAPWHSDYHLNVNLQEAYWLAPPLALPGGHEALFPLNEHLGAGRGAGGR